MTLPQQEMLIINLNLCLKNYHFKHTRNDDNDIGCRKTAKTSLLCVHLYISYLIHHTVGRTWHCNDEI